MKRPIRILLSIVSALIVAGSVWVYIRGPFLPMQRDRVFYNGPPG